MAEAKREMNMDLSASASSFSFSSFAAFFYYCRFSAIFMLSNLFVDGNNRVVVGISVCNVKPSFSFEIWFSC